MSNTRYRHPKRASPKKEEFVDRPPSRGTFGSIPSAFDLDFTEPLAPSDTLPSPQEQPQPIENLSSQDMSSQNESSSHSSAFDQVLTSNHDTFPPTSSNSSSNSNSNTPLSFNNAPPAPAPAPPLGSETNPIDIESFSGEFENYAGDNSHATLISPPPQTSIVPPHLLLPSQLHQ